MIPHSLSMFSVEYAGRACPVRIPCNLKGGCLFPVRKGLLLKPLWSLNGTSQFHGNLKKVRNPEYLPMRKTNSPHVWSRVLGSDVDVLKVGTVKIRYRDPVMRFTIQADVKRCPRLIHQKCLFLQPESCSSSFQWEPLLPGFVFV